MSGVQVYWLDQEIDAVEVVEYSDYLELLEALERLTARAERDICDPIDVPEIQGARQVIAKARGEA